MFGQVMVMDVKADRVGDLPRIMDLLAEAEQPDSGWLRTVVLHERADAHRVFTVVVFESEEKARARESDPRRQEKLGEAQALLREILTAPPQFHDCDVLHDTSV
jgi:heme-degrading monooxygenase HmoA